MYRYLQVVVVVIVIDVFCSQRSSSFRRICVVSASGRQELNPQSPRSSPKFARAPTRAAAKLYKPRERPAGGQACGRTSGQFAGVGVNFVRKNFFQLIDTGWRKIIEKKRTPQTTI